MANKVAIVPILASILLSSLFVAIFDGGHDEADRVFGRSLDRKKHIGSKKDKLSHFRFYWHGVLSGKNPTSLTVIKPVNGSHTFFGMVNMIDNALTMGLDMSSKMVGRAQGFYAMTSQVQMDLLMAMNFAFTEGKYNGSMITILGHNPVEETMRELPVVGGNGLFRFARGYAKIQTRTFDPKTGDATVEYNIYVFHY